jgi:hypothetical protein
MTQTTLERMAERDGYADLEDYGEIDEVAARQFVVGMAAAMHPKVLAQDGPIAQVRTVISRLEDAIYPGRRVGNASPATAARTVDLLIEILAG